MNARYDFGRNWSELAERFEQEHLDRACEDLSRLVGDVKDKTFLDIGCGSGLHSAATLRLGAAKVQALDYDTDCVETTKAVLSRFAPTMIVVTVIVYFVGGLAGILVGHDILDSTLMIFLISGTYLACGRTVPPIEKSSYDHGPVRQLGFTKT
ncbi:50S ribosomal protein L11 methyltransferase [Mesorhizobium silamurunense]|uniref:50S ribosomal protein L11 methyltransferase n=1 Tax=Mesorhizobium silamurunense TaxID=499528 RepID=UPI00177D347D|nr:50S ribosomal protein L11 methyltransferase [Mesorhizobium silamurunense]